MELLVWPHQGIMSLLQHMVGLPPSICTPLRTVEVINNKDCSTGGELAVPNCKQTLFMQQPLKQKLKHALQEEQEDKAGYKRDREDDI